MMIRDGHYFAGGGGGGGGPLNLEKSRSGSYGPPPLRF